MEQELISIWTKALSSFTIFGLQENSLIRELKDFDNLSPKLRHSLELTKISSTKGVHHKSNTIAHSMYEVYSSSISKTPSLYIVMGSVTAVNYTIVKIISVKPEGKRFKTKTLVGD
jgi:hypothetical protein